MVDDDVGEGRQDQFSRSFFFTRGGLGLENSRGWMVRRKACGLNEEHVLVSSRRDSWRYFVGRLSQPGSNGRASVSMLFLRDQFFHACSDVFLFQEIAAINLRQALLDLADEPFVVTD